MAKPQSPEEVGLVTPYFLYIHDDRYATPTMEVVTAADIEGARIIAKQRLDASPHHQAVEIWYEEKLLSRIGSRSL